MRAVLIFMVLFLATVLAEPRNPQRIIGGILTNIGNWPFAASCLYLQGVSYRQSCGGTIISSSAVLSAAHCYYGDATISWRVRVGSANANSGGVFHVLRLITIHQSYSPLTIDNDVAVLRINHDFIYNANVQPASIAGPNYNLADNQVVHAIGWGRTTVNGTLSEQLRQVQIWTVNQATCRSRYAERGQVVTDNMLCSGWLDVGGRDQCQGDSGGPLIHNNVIVGICSWGAECGMARYPGVNARVSRYTAWIQNAAA